MKRRPFKRGIKTKYKGIKRLPEKEGYLVRVTAIDPKTNQKRERSEIVQVATAEQAFAIKEQWKDELLRKKPKAPDVTLTDCAKQWLKQGVSDSEADSTLDKKEDVLNIHVLPKLGDYILTRMERGDLREWARWASARTYVPAKSQEARESTTPVPYAEDTVKGWWRTLQALLGWAVDEYDLDFNPAQGFDLDRYLNHALRKQVQRLKGPNSLMPDELPVFLETTRIHFEDWYAIGVWGFLCGMRWSELSCLNYGTHFDYENKEIVVNETQVRGKARDRTKTGVPRRIPYEDFMWEILQEHRQRLLRAQALGIEKGLVFPSSVGGYRATSAFPFDKICKKAGINKRLSSKCFRRTWEDLMRRAKVDAIVKRSMIGHSDERMSALYGTVHSSERHRALAQILPLAGFGGRK